MSTHGGKRKGAGRPKSKAKRITISASVHPDTPPKLRRLAGQHGSVGRAIDFLTNQP
jgi:hypothetical protein